MTSPDELTLGQGTCLSLVASGHHHGWAIVRELAPDAALGRIWSLSRPLVYRTIDQLVDRDLLARAGTEPGDGPARALLSITPTGRRQARRWAATPVTHLRDTRTELLVKLELCERLGIDRVEFLRVQRAAFDPIITAISERSPGDLTDLWRSESSTSIGRFLERAEGFLAERDDAR
jgi:DNA-binding PadR family transcriptional regulator